jgi:asparagine synthase (glutamine-hydrolysing)
VPDVDTAGAMLSAIAHRGPDGSGVLRCGNVVLGAARLAILDVHDRAAQPFAASGGSGRLVYNGELYNHIELRRELAGRGAFRTTSDTEVVAAAIHAWGVPAAVRRFDGMFAFAYVDGDTGDLWLARDRLGIKPLYVTHTGGTLVFASEIKALLAHPGVRAEPDPYSLLTGLLMDSLEEPWTPFAGIRALPRGELWRVHPDGSIDTDEYWSVLDAFDPARLADVRPTLTAAGRRFGPALSAAVRTHLQSDRPVAVFCSGGLDSSMIAAYAQPHRPELRGFAADVQGAKPELARARLVGRHLDLPIDAVRISHVDYLRAWPQAVWYEDVPLCVASDPAFLLLAWACRDRGYPVVLTGEGADELLCGYPWQAQAGPAWRWPALARWLWRRTDVGRWLGDAIPPDPYSRTARTFGNFDWPDPTAAMREACALHGGQKAVRHREILAAVAGTGPPAAQGRLAACLNSMYGHLLALLRRNDRMGMAASVEVRVPYLDNGVVDVALHLPMAVKWRRGRSKRVLRHLASAYLPRSAITAPKWGFSTSREPFRAALPLIERGCVPDLLRWSRRDTGRLLDELGGEAKPMVLFLVASIELWARIFLRGEAPDELGERLVAYPGLARPHASAVRPG